MPTTPANFVATRRMSLSFAHAIWAVHCCSKQKKKEQDAMQRVIMVIKIFLKICAIVSSVKKPAIKLQKKKYKKRERKGKGDTCGFCIVRLEDCLQNSYMLLTPNLLVLFSCIKILQRIIPKGIKRLSTQISHSNCNNRWKERPKLA